MRLHPDWKNPEDSLEVFRSHCQGKEKKLSFKVITLSPKELDPAMDREFKNLGIVNRPHPTPLDEFIDAVNALFSRSSTF